MIDARLMELIRCPVDGQALIEAGPSFVAAINQLIEQRTLRDASGGLVEASFDGALVTIDLTRAHAIRSRIPTLIPGEAITVPESIRLLVSATSHASSSPVDHP